MMSLVEVRQDEGGVLAQVAELEAQLFPDLIEPNCLIAEKERFLSTSKRNKIFACFTTSQEGRGDVRDVRNSGGFSSSDVTTEGAVVVGFLQCSFATSLAISGLGVSPTAWRKGHATALLSHVISLARELKISHASLYVSTASSPAISLYCTRFNFAVVDTIEGYYNNATDAHKLEATLE